MGRVQGTKRGGSPSYDSIKRFLRHLRKTTPVPFRRMETAPGQECQVDFGTGAPLVGTAGKRRRTHVFRIVLSHSRKGYSEAVCHQTTEDFIACLENAFWQWGGVTRTIVYDYVPGNIIDLMCLSTICGREPSEDYESCKMCVAAGT